MPRSPFRWTSRQDVELSFDDEDGASAELVRDPGPAGDEDDERAFIPLSGGSWDRRLTRRQKTIRAGSSIVVALVFVVMVAGGPGTVLAYLGNAAQALTPAPVAQAAAPPLPPTDVLDVPVPANISQNPQVSLSPVNGPDAIAYACWVDEPPNVLGEREAALHVASYAVASHNWSLLAVPVAQAAGCTVVSDMTTPARIVLALARAVGEASACALPDLYRSEDAGAHWASLPWPAGALAPCAVQLQMEGGRLYVQSDSRLLPTGAGLLAVTTDGGATWSAADGGLVGLSKVALVALRPDGHLLAQGIDPRRRGSVTLWQSEDAGAHWQFVMTAPGAQTRIYAASDPEATAHGGWGTLYAYANATGETSLQGLTDGMAGLVTVGATLATAFAEPAWMVSPLRANGSTAPAWTAVALEPDAASTDQRPLGAWQRGAGVGPDGSMLFTQPDAKGSSTSLISPFDLLVWNGRAWSRLAEVIPANATLQGVSWDGGVMRVWVTHKASVLRPVELFTFTVSSAEVG